MSENRFLYLSSTEVHSVLEDDYQLVIDSVEDALKMMYRGTTIQPDKNSQIFDENYQNRINCMAATLKDVETSGMKWVSVFPENKNRGLKNVEGFVVLSEIITGRMKCVMNATELTSLRTAGVGAVAAKYLARKNSSSIGFIGAGEEAKAHFKLIYFTNRNINRCFVSSRTCNSVKKFIEECYNVPILNLYGTTEFGYIFIEDGTGKMKLCPDLVNVRLEPVDGNNNIYSLIIDSYKNEYMPLINYKVGDMVQATKEEYDSFSKNKVVSRMAGREKDYNKIKLPVTIIDDIFIEFDEILLYQLQYISKDKFIIRYETKDFQCISKEKEEKLLSKIEKLNIGKPQIKHVQAISPERSGKFAIIKFWEE